MPTLTSLLHSQAYFFEKYGVEQGLSSSKVYTVIQDQNDWIWLGTESGLSRFNGVRFENFTSANGLAGGGVYSLMEDSLGRIWCGHLNGGLSIYDNGHFVRLKIDSVVLSGDVTSIKTLGNDIWITTINNGACRMQFPEKGDTILSGKQYSGKDGLSDQVSSSYISSNGDFYCVLPNAGIKKYNPGKDIFETYNPTGLSKYFAVIVMFQDSKGDFWFGTHNGGLYRQIAATGEMKIYDLRDGLAKNLISFITEDSKGNIWIGTWGGGISFITGEEIKIYNRTNGLEATSIHCIIEDKEKNIIIADHFTGISIFKGDHFVTFSDEKILPEKGVFAVEEDNLGRYWFGTNAGISVYNPGSEKNKVQIFNDSRNAIGNKIRFLKADRNGKMWVGTDGNGLSGFDLKTGRFFFDTGINRYLHANGIITALEVDNRNSLWIGNMDRLVVLDNTGEEITTYTQATGLAGNWIKVLFCDNKGNIWIGSEEKSGLTKYDAATGRFTIINIGEGYVPQTISQTTDGRIWIGTVSGLIGLENDSVKITLTEEKGLLSNNVKLLQPEGDNFLYIGTNYGLNRLNLTDSTIASFTKRNGFPGIETSANASLKDSIGNLWFGTANGVTMLAPGKMPPIEADPKTHISSIEVNYLPRQMEKDMTLNYKEKSLVFNYYSVSLTDPDAVKYRVMLKGADPDWRPPTKMTMEDYPTLTPGHYTFMVMASNCYGYWNHEPVEYSFIIKPPFYKTLWFIITCVLVAVIGVVAFIKIRERNLIREKRILEQKVEERTAEVVQKSMEIEEKNRDITASIRYAERIQRAMLPREDIFRETFVLFMPKDIVSGDFYWMYDSGDLQFIAACDCTGHGVPGAFMSIIGHNSLNKVVREYGITKPGAILDQLNIEVCKALMQRNEETITDGMDLALIAFDRNNFKLEFAGAYNPLYVVRNGLVNVYKGDRSPIGMSSAGIKKSFLNQPVDIQSGDMLYMCSDGYADQFGSSEGKKYKSGNVKKLLSRICELPVEEQREKLRLEILEWRGPLPQIDDILFVGTRIP